MIKKTIPLVFLLLFPNLVTAASIEAQANNPLAKLTTINLQNYYLGELTNINQTGDTAWLRIVKTLGNWRVRASLPYDKHPISPVLKTSGVGDFNAFAAYLIDTGSPDVNFGIGPMVVFPTAQPSTAGSGKWQAGGAMVLFDARSKKFQYGGLITYQKDVAGQKNQSPVSQLAVQPILIFQLGNKLYMRSSAIGTYSFTNQSYIIPLGLGLGKVIKSNNVVYNFYIEPQYSLATRGVGQIKRQLFGGINLQFY